MTSRLFHLCMVVSVIGGLDLLRIKKFKRNIIQVHFWSSTPTPTSFHGKRAFLQRQDWIVTIDQLNSQEWEWKQTLEKHKEAIKNGQPRDVGQH